MLLAASGAGPYSKLSKICVMAGTFLSFAGPTDFSAVEISVCVRTDAIQKVTCSIRRNRGIWYLLHGLPREAKVTCGVSSASRYLDYEDEGRK